METRELAAYALALLIIIGVLAAWFIPTRLRRAEKREHRRWEKQRRTRNQARLAAEARE